MDEESVSRARWSSVERRLRRLEQAAGLPNPRQPKGGPMARTPQEVDAMLERLERDATRHEGALHMQMVVNDDNNRRIDRVMDLYQRITARIQGIADQHDATVERIARAERRIGRLSSPLYTLLIGCVALGAWFALSAYIKSWVGDNVHVWLDGAQTLWRDHPEFGSIANRIVGGGAVFIIGMTAVCLLIDLISRPRTPAPRQQAQQPAQAPPPPIVTAEDLAGEVDNEGEEPAEELEPTQVINFQPVDAAG